VKRLLVGLTVCLLASLLLMSLADGVERGSPHLSMFLGPAVAGLWDGEYVLAAPRNASVSWFCIRAGEARCDFMPEKWWRRNTHRQIRWVGRDSRRRFLRQGGDTDISEYRFSRSRQFQGAVCSPG
jgi:hypothetical protein